MQNKNDEDFVINITDVGDITLDISPVCAAQETISISNMAGGIDVITIPPLTSDQFTYTLSDSDTINLNGISNTFIFDNVEWKNCFPDFHTVEKMCNEYPGLAKAFENFKTVYKMVEQDWKGKMENDQTNLF